ncbi:MAG: UvrD-helicase domain-containing protein [Desulfamplus sp.]|nr:UvrD-helicase domain-containing protein [Desulfamplus sp.]
MEFIADLHLHSHFSRATAKNLDLEHTYLAALIKGITVVGTGDFTHPGWFKELEEKLEPAEEEEGLFKLKDKIIKEIDGLSLLPVAIREKSIRFILQCEISSIYKKDGKVRKNHNLIYFPDMKSVKAFNEKLGKIGNITSDGRPILGLDCQTLLEIMLDTSHNGFMIPAHIWTPWFSMFGSKSGFDSVEECFGPLSDNIFAVETGLSSNLPMNWRVETLDKMSFISSSDAHSPMVMGRNASRFNTELSYICIRDALKIKSPNSNRYLGTIDMYPEEGKYHYDGHRKCNICFNPEETISCNGICPKCQKPLTLGVLYRVQELATRPEGYLPKDRHGYQSIIPLAEILSEIEGSGVKSKKVDSLYYKAIASLGNELDILLKLDFDKIDSVGISLLSEAIKRMREGKVYLSPGYDGEFGRVTLFTPEEIERLKGNVSMFKSSSISNKKKRALNDTIKERVKKGAVNTVDSNKKGLLNLEQDRAIKSKDRPLLIEAGPGTGKTHTLTQKIASLIINQNVNPNSILALTFTTKAAEEMKHRVKRLIGQNQNSEPFISTFHGFCLMVLKDYTNFNSAITDETLRKAFIKKAIELSNADNGLEVGASALSSKSIASMELKISMLKQRSFLKHSPSNLKEPQTADYKDAAAILPKYQELLSNYQLVDFEDLILMVLRLLEDDESLLSKLKVRFNYLFVDEYQDINQSQYQLIRLMVGNGANLSVIGDPDQSIYGFRGSDNRYFKEFEADYPNTEKIIFRQNYRSTKTILEASFQLISNKDANQPKQRLFSSIDGDKKIYILQAASEEAQAVMVGKTIEELVGGLSMFSMDAQKADSTKPDEYSFSDIAVLYRTKNQSEVISKVFERAGIPFQRADRDNIFLQKGVKELISFLRIVVEKETFYDDEILFKHNKSYKKVIASILAKSNKNNRVTALLLNRAILELKIDKLISQNKRAIEIVDNFLKEAEQYPDPALFYEHIAMKKDVDTLDYNAQKVLLMTMHASKGLEFKAIFIAGCEDGLIPFFNHAGVCEDIAEERRLFYVGMTRAEDRLYLCHAKKRQLFGKTVVMKRSQFIDDIEERLKHYTKSEPKEKRKSDENQEHQLELF